MKKCKNTKRKWNQKVFLAGTASALVTAVAVTGVWQYLHPVEVYARESFSGTKQIVEKYTGEEEFVMLDIVPSYATYDWNDGTVTEVLEFSTGTLGYLVKGQAKMESEYAKVYEKYASQLGTYTDRKAFVDAVWEGTDSQGLSFGYEEAYAGTRKALESEEEIAQSGFLYLEGQETLAPGDEQIGAGAHSGQLSGYYRKAPDEENNSTQEAERTGYDYQKVGDWAEEEFPDLQDAVYLFDPQSGAYRLTFAPVDAASASEEHPLSGYLMSRVTKLTSENSAEYGDETGVYLYDAESQSYYYAGELGEYRSLFTVGETGSSKNDEKADEDQQPSEEDTEQEEDEQLPEEGAEEDEKEQIPKDTLEEDGDEETESDDTLDTDDETESETDDETGNETQDPAGSAKESQTQEVLGAVRTLEPDEEETTYYIVEFEYYDSITDPSQKLYEVSNVENVSEHVDSQERPYDTYSLLSGSSQFSVTASNSCTFLYVGSGKGTYRLIDAADVDEDYRQLHEPVVMEVRNAPTYFRFTGGCDWLKEYVFHSLEGGNNENADFRLKVVTLRSDELTMEWIQKADFVYLENGEAPFVHTDTAELQWIGQSEETVEDADTGIVRGMTKENVYALLYRAVNDRLPVMVDASLSDHEHLEGSHYASLAKMLLKKNLEAYLQEARTSADWLFTHLDEERFPDKTDNDTHYVNHNVYVVHTSTPLVSGDFTTSFEESSAESGFAEILQLIRSENELLPQEDRLDETISKARAMEYIINDAVGLVVDYADLKILELQPSSNDRADLYGEQESGGTTLYFKRSETGAQKRQVLHSTSEMNVDVTVQSASSWNSDRTTINGVYNLVFIGLDGQKLNHSSDLWDTAVYNDDNLEYKLYHTGDLAAGSEERYDANDLTSVKKQELLDFMKAGYPVLVENDFFVDKTAKNAKESDINTKYVAKDTQMYQFLKSSLEKYADRLYTIDDVRNSILFRAQTALECPVISLGELAGGGLLQEEKAESGRFCYAIPYQVHNRAGEAYHGEWTAACYLDINGDGIFSEKENISQLSEETSDLFATAENGSFLVTFQESPGSRAISYMLRVCDSSNSYLRSEVQGVLQFTSEVRERLRILQIGEKNEASLSALYGQDNSVLGYYLKQAEGTLNVDFEITTMGMSEDSAASIMSLSTMLERNPQFLNQYDLVILGFDRDFAELPSRVVTAIEQYIEEGRSVLLSDRAASKTENRLGLSKELLGQTDGRTYVSLGRDSGRELFRYRGLSVSQFGPLSELSAEGINEGSIYSYPNLIGKLGSFSAKTELCAGDYRLDLEQNGLLGVTPWFVLTGTKDGAYAYRVSARDGANNYYLYSKGNVVYIGHQDYAQYTYQAENEEYPVGDGLWESQLFVNAMILAYNAGVHGPKVDIVAGYEELAAQVESISVPFDQDLAEEGEGQGGLLEETVDVYFRYQNSNLAQSCENEFRFYYEDADGTILLNTEDGMVTVTAFSSELWSVQEHELVQVAKENVKQGQVYGIKAPVDALKNHTASTEAKIYVEMISKLQRPEGVREVRGYDCVTLNRVQLFLLE